jgi:hypothetical protein
VLPELSRDECRLDLPAPTMPSTINRVSRAITVSVHGGPCWGAPRCYTRACTIPTGLHVLAKRGVTTLSLTDTNGQKRVIRASDP